MKILHTGKVVLVVMSLLLLAPLQAMAKDVVLQSDDQQVRSKLEPFAGAYKNVSHIYESYTQRIMQSEDPVQAQALQQEANEKMNKAVADHGLSVEDYNAIFLAIQGDPNLQEEFMVVLGKTPER